MEKHSRIVGKQRHVWMTKELWKQAADLPVIDVLIEDIPEIDINCWFETREPTIREVAKHAKRINDADLSYPIILNQEGALMDGGHRICKALHNGLTHIKAVQFRTTPEPHDTILLEES